MLRVRLLGEMAAEVDGSPVRPPDSARARALLAWLALNPGMHARTTLAARFWPDVLDSSARASLRSAIWSLRRALGEAGETHLLATRDRVGLENVQVDAREFDELVRRGELREAVAMSKGDLLPGLDDDWAFEARDAHRDQLASVLCRLAAESSDPAEAVSWAKRWAALDPLSEEAGRALIGKLAEAGDRAAALAAFERLAGRLRTELGLAPSAETRGLVERVRAEASTAAQGPVAVESRPRDAGTGRLPGPVRRARGIEIVGRGPELGELRAAWRSARSGGGAALVLSGEPGIGKTRLAGEILAEAAADGALAAACGGLELGSAAPFGIWAELLRDVTPDLEPPPAEAAWPSDVARLAPDLERRFGRSPAPPGPPELERARLFEGIVGLLEWAARERPLALLVEDAHLADGPSLELAGYAGRRIADLPVLLVITRRTRPRRPELDTLVQSLRGRGVLAGELELEPLSPDAVGDLARSVAPLSEADVTRVVNAAEGNALLAVETARAVAAGERTPPPSLRGLVRAGVAALDQDAQLVAELAAAAGRDLERGETASLAIDDFAGAATRALESGFLVATDGRIGFRHALLRDAVYDDIPDPRRASLHQSLAIALDRAGQASAAEVARHLRLAGDDDSAVEHLARAAHEARDVGALAEAAGFLEEAVRLAPDRPDLLLDLGEVEAWRVRPEATDRAFKRAIALLEPGDPAKLAEAWLDRARAYRSALCTPHEVNAACSETIAVLDRHGMDAPRLRARALAGLAWTEAAGGDADTVDRRLRELHEIIGRDRPDDVVAYDLSVARGFAFLRRGQFEDAVAPTIAGGEAAQRLGRPDMAYGAWANAACIASALGDFDLALRFAERATASVGHLPAHRMQTEAARAHILARMGRFDEALEATDRELALADMVGEPLPIATARHDRGLVAVAAGRWEEGEAFLAEALESGASISRPLTHLTRAEALTRLGRVDEAEAELRATTLEPLRPSDYPDTLVARLTRIQGLIAAARGDVELAERRLREAAAGWRRRLASASADGEAYVSNLTDLGRPPVLGLVEPARELERVERELESLEAVAT